METVEIILNGQKICKAGILSKQSSFGVIVNMALSEGNPSLINLDVSGLDIEKDEHLHWHNSNLEINDEVIIRIIESPSADEPSRKISRSDRQKRYLEDKLESFYKLREELKEHIKD